MSKKYQVILVVLVILIVDQALKLSVKSNLMLEEEYVLLGDWLYLHFTENKGMAFGFEFAGVTGKYILSIIRILAVTGMAWLIHVFIRKNVKMSVIMGLAVVLAGAMGNIIDSAFYGMFFTDSFGRVADVVPFGQGYAPFLQGKVVDMFYVELLNFHLPEWFPFWPKRHIILFRPIFNMADMAITSGIAYLLLFRRKAFHLSFL